MRVVAGLLVAMACIAAAQPRHQHHRHQHMERRELVKRSYAYEVVYELDGKQISREQAEEGLRTGKYYLLEGGKISTYDASVEVKDEPTEEPKEDDKHKEEEEKRKQEEEKRKEEEEKRRKEEEERQKEQKPKDEPKDTSSSSDYGVDGIDREFPDGELNCDEFPEGYGLVARPDLGLGKWTGIQIPKVENEAGYDDIFTQTKDTCNGSDCCSEGAFCSYACPGGWEKTQWPKKQGATRQSIGGLLCKGGKLHLTNPEKSNKLCQRGTDKVRVYAKNERSKNVAICQTDYPGIEAMTVPVNLEPGEQRELTCPDAAETYKWGDKETSAQYYVNPEGVPMEDACQWSTPDSGIGNWAPLNLGIGWNDGLAWGAVFSNTPTTNERLKYNVRIESDCINGSCCYENEQYCGVNGCNDQGCTVSAPEGCTLTYVFF